MLKRRSLNILEHILSSKEGISGNELAKLLGISSRTIRNDIKEINLELSKVNCKITSSPSDGYTILPQERTIVTQFLHDQKHSSSIIPITPSERELYICMTILFSDGYCTIDDIADQIFASRTTVNADIKRIKKYWLDKNQIKLDFSSSKGIYFLSKESKLRLLISNLISKYYDSNLPYLKILLKHFLKYNDELLFHLYEIIMQVLDSKRIVLTDKSLYIFTLECLVTINRSALGFLLEADYVPQNDSLINIPFHVLEDLTNTKISENDRSYLDTCYSYKRLLSSNAQTINDTVSDSIINEYLNTLKNNYLITFDDNLDLKSNLSQHLNTMIKRLQYDDTGDSPLIVDVKTTYPYPFELATAIIPILKRTLHINISEAELSYIAIHLAVILDNSHPKLNVIIVCGSSLGTAQLVINRLRNQFGDKINVLTFCPLYKLQDILEAHPETDLVITTIPIEERFACPVIKISPLVTKEETLALSHYINHTAKNTHHQKEDDLLNPNFFFICHNDVNKNKILQTMIYELYKYQYIDSFSTFYASVMERENLYSTKYDSIWLPHPMCGMSKTTVMSVAIIKDSSDIKLILLCAINAKETQKFKTLYGKISVFIEDERLFKELCKANSFEEFKNIFDLLEYKR